MMLVFCHRDVEEGNPVVEVDNGGVEVRAEVNTKEQAGD